MAGFARPMPVEGFFDSLSPPSIWTAGLLICFSIIYQWKYRAALRNRPIS